MKRAARLRERLSGAATVGGGLVLLGAAAYLFLALAGHALEPSAYASVASLYFLTAIIGPGLFVAVEQETNREMSSRIAAGIGTAPVGRSSSLVSGAFAALVIVGLFLLSPLLIERVFDNSWALFSEATISVAGAAAVYVLRGLYAGRRRYGWYSATLAAEGLARLIPCIGLVLLGNSSPVAFGLVFVLGAGIAAVLTVAGLRPGDPGPPVDRGRMARGVGLLAGASGLTLLVANLAPVIVTSRLVEDPRTAASFASLFILARTPLFLFGPVQALLLPGLSAAVTVGDAVAFRRQFRTVLFVVCIFGVLGTLLAWLFGSWASRVFFAAPAELPTMVAASLGGSTAVMMVAQVLQPVLVALRVHRVATVAWLIGTAIFIPLLFLPIEPVTAAILAQLIGPVVVVVIMVFAVHRGLADLTSATMSSPSRTH